MSISAWLYLPCAARASGLVLPPSGKLTAGCVDIVPARPARRHYQSGGDQDFGEAADGFARRALETGIGERIERNQVELAWDVAHQCDQLSRMFRAVVDALEPAVLAGHDVARRLVPIARARGKQLGERGF